MKSFKHDYRVFEAIPTLGAQIEVTLVSSPDPTTDRHRPDRVTTGACMGRLRLIVDMAHIDTFAAGNKFTLELTEKVAA